MIDGQVARQMTPTLVARAPAPVLAAPRPEDARAEALPFAGAVEGVMAAAVRLSSVEGAAAAGLTRDNAADRAQLHGSALLSGAGCNAGDPRSQPVDIATSVSQTYAPVYSPAVLRLRGSDRPFDTPSGGSYPALDAGRKSYRDLPRLRMASLDPDAHEVPPPAMTTTAPSQPAETVRPAEGGPWLSLGPASRLVGVDPDTLRRWADDGRLRAFTTPGGHRRFDRRDLERLVDARRPARRSLSTLGATPDRLARAYARSYRATDLAGSSGFADVDRDAFRAEGRRLITALLAYLDAATPAQRRRWEAAATVSVRATGERLAHTGADVLGAISTFVAARRPFLAELAALGRRRSLDVAALTALYDDAAALLDRLLLQLIDAFQPVQEKR